ncbi:Haloacid dehalogenase-like hydrolase domain-containing protein Sgpp [Morella rubra]|uniref:Haloacid dehalogenase-like hydrolase domain-containing protein Sgpp n=1 Tax=Morella rubra TaxID=262757 RepID=A0A6A1VSI9_9ROSI|nr:Haloacid dehalogenase-like hydrolase domain-containing protein Sgpp [Morella rubra]
MLQEIGFNGGVPITEEFYVENIAGKHNDDVAVFLFPDDIQRGLKFTDDKEAMFRRLAPEQLKPVDGVYKVKKWVEDRGLKRAAVTNAPRPNAELMISLLGLSDFFDALVIGEECEHTKPDSVSGIKAGVAAGMPVVGLTTRNPEHLLMEAKPALLIKAYDDPKLWSALEELDKNRGTSTVMA